MSFAHFLLFLMCTFCIIFAASERSSADMERRMRQVNQGYQILMNFMLTDVHKTENYFKEIGGESWDYERC